MELTKEESQFIVSLLAQLTIKASDPAAAGTIEMVQSIVNKLSVPETKNVNELSQ